jgi:hypothetical protein
MRIKHAVAAAVFVILPTLLSSMPAHASLISIAFNTTDSNNPSGEPLNTLGLQLPGQVGPWDGLTVGSGDPSINLSDEKSITVDGVTFRINTGGAASFSTFLGAGDDLRSPVVFLRSNGNQSVN